MSAEERVALATELSAAVLAKAEELSTAIYEARKMGGYHVFVRVLNGTEVEPGKFVGSGDRSIVVRASVYLEIGETAV